ncbi:MAG: hypothetical protein HRU13_12955 [Phycisphaerales bacterium]|nr:hypothetical protein [Phycisphaerales bacterium]
MPTYITSDKGSFTITGSGAPVSNDVKRWAINFTRRLANVTTYADTANKYAAALPDGSFQFDVQFDDAGSAAPIPSGTEINFTGVAGTGHSYAFPGIIEGSAMQSERDGGARAFVMRYTGRINGDVTVT